MKEESLFRRHNIAYQSLQDPSIPFVTDSRDESCRVRGNLYPRGNNSEEIRAISNRVCNHVKCFAKGGCLRTPPLVEIYVLIIRATLASRGILLCFLWNNRHTLLTSLE